ncbi:hypothetical protein D3C77_609060 [compost metagenome]
MDAHHDHYRDDNQFELAVSTAASILEYGAREGLSMGLCTLANEIEKFAPASGITSIGQMLRHLVDLDRNGSGKPEHRLESISQFFTSGCFFVIISPLNESQLKTTFHFAKSKLMTPYHIQIGEQATVQKTISLSGMYVTSLQELPIIMGGGRTA